MGCPTSPRHRLVSVTLTASRTPGPECPRYDHTVEDTGGEVKFNADLVTLEILYGAFVPIRRFARLERAKVFSFSGFRILLSRIQAKFPGCEFSNLCNLPLRDSPKPFQARARAAFSTPLLCYVAFRRPLRACRESAAFEAARCPSRLSAVVVARERFAEGFPVVAPCPR